jgi:hypothetical protein
MNFITFRNNLIFDSEGLFIDGSKEVGLELNGEELSTCYTLVTRMQRRIMKRRELTDPMKI